MRQYVALATSKGDPWIVLVGELGESKEGVKSRALAKLDHIEQVTTVTVAQCKRAFPRAWSHYEYAQRTGIPY